MAPDDELPQRRTARGSLAGAVDLSADRDSPEVNLAIARDVDVSPDREPQK